MESASYLADVLAALKQEWPGNRTVNIVCHGHSVPAGYFQAPNVDSMNAYPHLLHRGLKERFPNAVINVIVTAVGGENSVAGAARFKRDVLRHRPDIVTLDYSLNDRGIGLEEARMAWVSMIEAAQERDIRVVLLTPTADTMADMDDPGDPLNRHADQVRALAEEYGVGLADSLKEFRAAVASGADLEDLMSQANHPNRRGHELVVTALLALFQ